LADSSKQGLAAGPAKRIFQGKGKLLKYLEKYELLDALKVNKKHRF